MTLGRALCLRSAVTGKYPALTSSKGDRIPDQNAPAAGVRLNVPLPNRSTLSQPILFICQLAALNRGKSGSVPFVREIKAICRTLIM
ncbi:hypothetical protein KCP70_24985 [Salmonella enterica subsp. enterica]|nr:hypothetical protein KCP70_24985 [Salmonella enterica subsp. enterica]